MSESGETVFEFDSLFQPEFARAPQPYFRHMRDTNPVMRAPSMFGDDGGSTVFVAKHEDIEHVLRDPAVFSSKFGREQETGIELIPITIDPPDHLRYRRLLDPLFGPKQMNKLHDDITRRANALIDAFVDRGSCDYAQEYAVPLPCGVFLDLMGLPSDEIDQFIHWKEGILRGSGASMFAQDDVRKRAHMEATERFEQLIAERRAEPRDDLLTVLLNVEVEGAPLTDKELLGICHLFLIAGLDTVTDSLTCFYAFLAANPAHRDRLVADPDIIPNAVEEMLRYESPVPFVPRVVAEPAELSGSQVEPGDNLVLLIGSANTDERAQADADVVDFDRESVKHLAFGDDIHRCLGSHLARLELRVSLREWHRRIPEYHIPEGVELAFSPVLRQVDHLPLEFDRVVG